MVNTVIAGNGYPRTGHGLVAIPDKPVVNSIQ